MLEFMVEPRSISSFLGFIKPQKAEPDVKSVLHTTREFALSLYVVVERDCRRELTKRVRSAEVLVGAIPEAEGIAITLKRYPRALNFFVKNDAPYASGSKTNLFPTSFVTKHQIVDACEVERLPIFEVKQELCESIVTQNRVGTAIRYDGMDGAMGIRRGFELVLDRIPYSRRMFAYGITRSPEG